MPIGSQKQIDAMRSGIDVLYQRMRAIQPQLSITHEDVLNTFVEPEHRSILRSAADIAYMSRADRWIDLHLGGDYDGVANPEFSLVMLSHGGVNAPLTPRYVCVQPDAPAHVIASITSWVTERLEMQRRFGVIAHVFDKLRNKLDTAKQLRYVWPSALILAQNCSGEHIDSGVAWATKYSAFSPQCHPHLDLDLRKAIRDASVTITTASLLPAVTTPPATPPQVAIKLRGYTTFEAYGETIIRYGHTLES